jgi:hypothetical protein
MQLHEGPMSCAVIRLNHISWMRTYVVLSLQLDENTLACTYATLILHDDGLPITAANVSKLIEVRFVVFFLHTLSLRYRSRHLIDCCERRLLAGRMSGDRLVWIARC